MWHDERNLWNTDDNKDAYQFGLIGCGNARMQTLTYLRVDLVGMTLNLPLEDLSLPTKYGL